MTNRSATHNRGAPKGSKNGRWNNGTSDYPDHGLMKRNRLTKLQQVKGHCEVCGAVANVVHHVDGDRSNHTLTNLVVVCHSCHAALHASCVIKPHRYVRKRTKIALSKKQRTALITAANDCGGFNRLAIRAHLSTDTLYTTIKRGWCIQRTYARLKPFLSEKVLTQRSKCGKEGKKGGLTAALGGTDG